MTDGVSITPTPRPIRNSPGTKATTREEVWTKAEEERDAGEGDDEAGDDQRPLREPLREPLWAKDETRMPTVAAVKMTPVWIAL